MSYVVMTLTVFLLCYIGMSLAGFEPAIVIVKFIVFVIGAP